MGKEYPAPGGLVGDDGAEDKDATASAFQYRGDSLRSLETEGSDPFGHRDYANTVVSELADFPPQFTLGLFGDWGSGKSTILGQVGKQLRADQSEPTAFVLFDAWRYEGDSLRRELIRTVGGELEAQDALREGFDFERHIEFFESETTTSRRRFGFDGAALRDGLVAAGLIGAITAALILALPKAGLSKETTLKFLIAIASAITAFVLFALQRVFSPEPVQSTRRRLEFPDQFAANFKTLLDNVAAKRLVIAIDNLDRCAPARVTEMLSAVKTFLEPAFEEGPTVKKRRSLRRWLWEELGGEPPEPSLERLCFIVAADDKALRRHLTAQELGNDRLTQGAERSGELPAEVRASVDEYLRKFFGAHLRIRELLDEDVRAFAEEELAGFVASRELDPAVSRRLVEITSQGLKRNPRRIKQFVNNLQLRMQIFAERRDRRRVQIEPDVLFVAKLAIIEEEFADHFDRLLANPTLLASWQRQAREPEAKTEMESAALDEKLADFLRFTDDLQTRDIRAYLTLKQTRDEVEMPRYSEFVDLLDAGDSGGMAELLGEEPGDETRYARAARTYLGAQRQAKAWSRAHNSLRVIIEVPLLHGEESRLVREAVELALQEPELEGRLGQLDPATLLDVATVSGLGGSQRRRVVRAVIGALTPEGTRAASAAALASHAAEIEDEDRARIAVLLAAEKVRGDFAAFLPVAEAMPQVLGSETLDAALARIEEEGAAAVASDSAAFVVAVLGLGRRVDGERLGRLLGAVRAALGEVLERKPDEIAALAPGLAAAVRRGPDNGEMRALVEALIIERERIAAPSRRAAIELAIDLCVTSPEADAASGAAVANWLFSLDDATVILDVLEAHFARLPEQIKIRLPELAAEALSGALDNLDRDDSVAILQLFEPDVRESICRRALSLALAGERVEAAEMCFERLNEEERSIALGESLERARGAPIQQAGDLAFVFSRSRDVQDDELFALVEMVVQRMDEDRGTPPQLGPILATASIADSGRRLSIVQRLLAIEMSMSDIPNREATLRAAHGVAGRRASRAKSDVASRLAEIERSDGDQLQSFARRLRGGD